MTLTKLRIENFKSFGGTHVVEFRGTFTAVVGPNGAGKSNLMDAIAFVLGVQSRHLRSTKLGELLHRGAPLKQGAAARRAKPRAMVELEYERDEDEDASRGELRRLRLARTVSPVGVGGYRVDGEDVTREQYEEQLRSIGVLVKARNFLVLQGDVETLAQSSAHKLGELLEQISGSERLRDEYESLKSSKDVAEEESIFAFKARKSLTAQRRQIKEQREEAEHYSELLQTHTLAKREYFLWQVEHARSRMAERVALRSEAEAELDAARVEETEVAARLREVKASCVTAQREVTSLEKRRAQGRTKMRRSIEPAVVAKREELRARANSRARQAEAVERLERELVQQQAKLAGLRADIERLVANEAELQAEALEGCAPWRRDAEVVAEFERVRNAADCTQASDVRSLESAERRAVADRAEERELEERHVSACARLGDAREALHACQERESASAASTSGQERERYEMDARASEAAREERECLEAQTKAESQLARCLEELRECRESLPGGRHSLKERENASRVATLQRLFGAGVRGRLVDCCKPAQRKYATAVAVCVGQFAEAIVVDERSVAIECIRHLREQRLGTATFLALDSLRPEAADERLRALGAGFALAVDVIQCDPCVFKAVAFACKQAVICDTLDDARGLCYGATTGVRGGSVVKAVTLAGALISKSGTLTGGFYQPPGSSAKQGAGRAWRAADATRLETQQTVLEETCLRCRARRRELDLEAPELARQRATLEAKQRYTARDCELAERRCAQLLCEHTALERSLEQLVSERDAAAQKAAQSLETKRDLAQRVRHVRCAALRDLAQRCGVPLDTLLLEDDQHDAEEQEASVVAMSSSSSSFREKLSASAQHRCKLEAQLRYEEERALTAQRDAARRRELDDARLVQELERDAEDLQAKELSANTALAVLETSKLQAVSVAQKQTAQLKQLHDERQALAQLKLKAARAMAAQELALEKLRSRLHEVATKAKVEHVQLPLRRTSEDGAAAAEEDEEEDSLGEPKLTPEDSGDSTRFSTTMMAQQDVLEAERIDTSSLNASQLATSLDDETFDRDQTKRRARCEQLFREIEQLAPNLKAGELFDEIALKLKQADDQLVAAREHSRAAANAFEDVKRRRQDCFNACFELVSAKLSSYYADITKSQRHPVGGHASLSVNDADEPYLAGVVFNATPPSKRFCEISQLSGGERTLASMALLFALHAFHPAPFMIMDEVDAALDSVNVNKLARFVTNQSKQLQIIAVSLKDQFYTQAKSLVGVAKDINSASSQPFTLEP